ncbi:SDR family NAD(P)-dependent oxidoreductase [Kitasatospora sp. NPDC048365]|uniref:SDR family NAD(P)-dependent oxidoreductase n=1 Tax=Kitasatospora sp. NPDC048365 TaxID=3364050 RepID=UPI00371CE296
MASSPGSRTPRNVLITGGSAGIGEACAERFARGGDEVWFTYRNGRERAAEIVSRLVGQYGPRVRAFEFNQGDPADHERLVAELPGPVDVLVNNAAVGSATVGRYADGSPAAQDEAFLRINALGPLWLTRALLPGMLERGRGKVVNISSVGGGIGVFPGFRLVDGMSKAALGHFTRQLAAELVHRPVDVYAVCPGATETGMFAASTLDALTAAEHAALLARLPGGRLIQPREIADTVHWLAGPDSAALHGAVLDASMGLGVHPGLLTGAAAAHPADLPGGR